MAKYRKKPVVIEAEQFTEQHLWDYWLKKQPLPEGCNFRQGSFHTERREIFKYRVTISTLEGPLEVQIGDWIITGVKGERYPCKPDIFAATYEFVA